MKIGLDFDGVFCDAEKLLKDGARKKFGLELLKEKTMSKCVVKEGVLTQKDFDELRHFSFEDSSNGLNFEAVLDVDTACRTLIDRGHKVQIITQRNHGVCLAKDFCQKMGLKLPIIGMEPNQPKSSVAIGLDVFLDDSPRNIEDLKSAVSNPLLFSWSYNQNFSGKKVNSWTDFVREIS